MTLASFINLTSLTDSRGQLVIAESARNLPFQARRIYYLTNLLPDSPRGFHAHKKLDQLAVCVRGKCEIVLDDGKTKETVLCNDPAVGLRIPPMVWHEMQNFSEDCLLLVFASDYYDEGDYIREYSEFLQFMNISSLDEAFIHHLADVASDSVLIGAGTRVWQYVVILSGATIGRGCNLCAHTLIEGDVAIGHRVTIKSGVQIWDGVVLEDDVFVGPNVTFTNDRMPRSRSRPEAFEKTVVEKGASIGANSTILPGIRIGQNAMVGSGSVVTRDVPPNAVVYGNPAKIARYLNNKEASQS